MITGSNRGLGLSLTRAALDRGDYVFGTCRSPENALGLRDLQQIHGERLQIVKLDIQDPASREAARAHIAAQVPALDVLFNNAGIYIRDSSVAPEAKHFSLARLDESSLLHMLSVNAVAPLLVTQKFLPMLVKGASPVIAFMSSEMGSIGHKNAGEIEYSYSASKAALNMLARSLAFEVSNQGVAVVCLNPGWVATDMGTSRAPLQPDPVAKSLWSVIDGVSLANTGSFQDWQGSAVSW